MRTIETINLIRTKTSVSPQWEASVSILQKISLGSLLILIFCGITVGSVFFYLRLQQEQLSNTKTTLNQSVTRNITKEGLLLSLEERVAIANKIIGNQRPIPVLFDTIGNIASPPQLISMTFDDRNEVVLTIHAGSIGDVGTVVGSLLQEVFKQHAKSPKLLSFTLTHDASIELTISFIALF